MPVDGIDPKGMTALMYCAGRGQVKMVLQLITMGASVDQQDERGWCALHHASLSGGSKLCKLLLVAGSDKLAVTKDGEMALDLAKRAPKSVSQKKIIELLLMYQPQRIPRDEYIRFAGQLVGIDVDASVNASVDLTRSFDESSVLTPLRRILKINPTGAFVKLTLRRCGEARCGLASSRTPFVVYPVSAEEEATWASRTFPSWAR